MLVKHFRSHYLIPSEHSVKFIIDIIVFFFYVLFIKVDNVINL